MAEAAIQPVHDDERLIEFFSKYVYDPLGFVYAAFPWGVEGSPLEKARLEEWQRKRLIEIGEKAAANQFNGQDAVAPILMATASGHGIGKSAFSAMITLWILCTRPESQGVISANSKPQLKTKTFKELVYWTELLRDHIGCDWWEISTADLWIRHRDRKATWRADGLAWEERAPEAFAGLHCLRSTAFIILDEASGIPLAIWEALHGALTDGEPMWFAWGNPTRNTGFFHRIFHRLRHRWSTMQVDSRECRITNKRELQEWIDVNGIDSDFVRIRVLGKFPRSAASQLIPNDVVHAAAQHNTPQTSRIDPLIMGVDVAREGDDESVVAFRRGQDATTEPWMTDLRGFDSHQLGGRIAEYCQWKENVGDPVDAIFVDATGVGSGVLDFLRHRGYPVFGVNFGAKANDERQFLRKGAEMWCAMRDWMKAGGRILDDNVLHDQLTGRNYAFTDTDKMFLEPKKIMKADGRGSPDRGDALALTFASPVAKRSPEGGRPGRRKARGSDYDPMENI